MQQELTPKQQAVELIKQANHILLVTGKDPNNDQLSSMVALEIVLTRAGKQVSAIVTSDLPKARQVLDTKRISKDLSGIRDFVIRLDTSTVEVDKLRYEQNEGNLEVIISPFAGNFTSQDASYDYGAFKFDLVVVLGVSGIAKIDGILAQNPTIFDGLHLINIDCHRYNESFGSVNYIEPNASSVCEMLVGILESVAQGMIDYHVATALLAGIMSSTQGFTGANTSAKSLTIAAQMMSNGAKQQEIVQALFSRNDTNTYKKPVTETPQPIKSVEKPTHSIAEERLEQKPEQKIAPETIADKLAKQGVELTQEGVKDVKTGEIVVDEESILEVETKDEATLQPKKFKNPEPKKQ